MFYAIRTKHSPATNHRNAGILATCDGVRARVEYDHALGERTHYLAALAALRKRSPQLAQRVDAGELELHCGTLANGHTSQGLVYVLVAKESDQ